MAAGVFDNASLEHLTLKNTNDAALDTRTFVAFDKTNVGGMVDLADSNAGEIAGLVEEYGIDNTTLVGVGVPVANIPVGQVSRVRYRGVARARCAAVTVVAGTKAYVLTASGKMTNVSNSGANLLVGVFLTGTDGTADALAVVRFDV